MSSIREMQALSSMTMIVWNSKLVMFQPCAGMPTALTSIRRYIYAGEGGRELAAEALSESVTGTNFSFPSTVEASCKFMAQGEIEKVGKRVARETFLNSFKHMSVARVPSGKNSTDAPCCNSCLQLFRHAIWLRLSILFNLTWPAMGRDSRGCNLNLNTMMRSNWQHRSAA